MDRDIDVSMDVDVNMDKSGLLKKIKVFVLDMDGTFYLGDKILPDSLRFIARVRETGRRFLFFTNNSSKTPALYIEKLRRMGVKLERTDLLTSGDVCIDYLRENYRGSSVFLMGTESLKEDFEAAGIRMVGDTGVGNGSEAGARGDMDTSVGNGRSVGVGGVDVAAGTGDANVDSAGGKAGTPDVVVCAFDTELTYTKLERACTYIRNGAIFLATHEDINCPTEDGFIPDCGSMCAAISLSTGRKPKFLGKPHSETVEKVLSATGASREEIAFVGDRLYTDVAAGVNNGATGFLVLSGETKEEDLTASPIKPAAVFSGLGEIADLL